MPEVLTDLTPFVQAKSDQINADDLISGPITVTITGAFRGGAEQPVEIALAGHKLYRPCKTCSRILLTAWGKDPRQFVGRSMTLYRDPNVRFGGQATGGIRISHLSHIEGPLTVVLAESKGKKSTHAIKVLQSSGPDLATLLADNEITRADVDRWRASINKPAIADSEAEAFAAWLVKNPKAIDAIRALIPQEGA